MTMDVIAKKKQVNGVLLALTVHSHSHSHIHHPPFETERKNPPTITWK